MTELTKEPRVPPLTALERELLEALRAVVGHAWPGCWCGPKFAPGLNGHDEGCRKAQAAIRAAEEREGR
jgi:hypothetical protein